MILFPPAAPSPQPTIELPSNLETKKLRTLAEIGNQHPRAYEKWTAAEDSELAMNYREGFSVSQLAERHQRQRSAIRSRLRKLGLQQ